MLPQTITQHSDEAVAAARKLNRADQAAKAIIRECGLGNSECWTNADLSRAIAIHTMKNAEEIAAMQGIAEIISNREPTAVYIQEN